MNNAIRIHSFIDADRSGKVRWTAEELGYDIEEIRLQLGDQATAEYCRLNPYAQIPTVELEDKVLIESTAICLALAERHPERHLIPESGPRREHFWQSVFVSTSTLEQLTVNYALSQRGVVDEVWADLVEKPITLRLRALAGSLPETGYLLESFSLADIFAAYPLRTAVVAGLLPMEGVLRSYLDRLRDRPAARRARFFHTLPAQG
jgi:glutathione S-transferase